MILFLVTISSVTALPVHNLDSGEDFATIQGAINAANTTAGHTISCDDQVYDESVLVWKGVTLLSTNDTPEDCIIRSTATTSHTVNVAVANVDIRGFSIENGSDGVNSVWRSNVTVKNCIFQNNTHYSYYASSSPYLEVTNCVFNGEDVTDQLKGIRCSYVYVANNTFNTPAGVEGIDFTSPRHSIFENNTMSGGTTAMYIKRPGTGFIPPKILVIKEKIMMSRPALYSKVMFRSEPSFEQDKVIVRNNDVRNAGHGIRSEGNINNHDQYGDIYIYNNEVHTNGNNIYTRFLNGTFVYENNVSGGGASIYGIRFHQSNYTYVYNNSVNTPENGSQYGIHHDSCNFSYVEGNHIDKSMYGLFFRAGDVFEAKRNIILNCTYRSIFVTISQNGTIYDNIVATDVSGLGTNCYEYGSPTVKFNITKTLGTNIIGGAYIGGNYWSDYNGSDLDNDGFGDEYLPYDSEGYIQSGGGDYLPIVIPKVSRVYILTHMGTAHALWVLNVPTPPSYPLYYHWNVTNTTDELACGVTPYTYSGPIGGLLPGNYTFYVNATDNITFSDTIATPFVIDASVPQPTRAPLKYGALGAAGLFVMPLLMKSRRDKSDT